MKEILENIFLLNGIGLCSNVYLLKSNDSFIAIDSGNGSINFDSVEINKVFLTHGHFDHTKGMKGLKCNGFLHKRDFVFIEKKENIKELKEKEIVFGDFCLKAIETPGHTLGSICFIEERKGLLFSGDTLFEKGVGRTDLGGDARQMLESIELLEKIPFKKILPGHGTPFEINKREYFSLVKRIVKEMLKEKEG